MKVENLRIIADDMGLAKSVNDGIIFLLKGGKINGVSLMANGEAFDDAVEKLKSLDRPNIGIHLVLVEERSVSGIRFPKNHKSFFIKYALGLIKLFDIEKELRSQINKCLQAGIKPSFINSHQHLHLLPRITDLVIKLSKEYQIDYIRTVNEPINFTGGKFFRKLQLLFLNFLSEMAKRKIKNAGLRCNDFFVGFANAGNIGSEDIKHARMLALKYSDQVIELGCHPGYENEDLKNKYKHWGNYNWGKEQGLLENIQ